MLKKSALVLSLAIISGCSAVSSYDRIANNVEYTYDHTIKQSVIKGPIDDTEPQGADIEDFSYNLMIKENNTFANISFNYEDKSTRQYTHVVDSMGVRYNFVRNDYKVVDCGIVGTMSAGVCSFEESFTFQLPRDNRYQFALIGKEGKNVYFKVKQDYVAVMDDVIYKLKTPRSDYDEVNIKKEALLAAKPVPVVKSSVQIPQPVVGNAIATEKMAAPVVLTPIVNKPLIVGNQTVIKKFENSNQCNCQNNNNNVVATKITVSKTPVLTPALKSSFCEGIKFKNSCEQITSCREAYDQYSCGNKKLDPTKKGMPCPTVCKL
jgi:hypothetical protein